MSIVMETKQFATEREELLSLHQRFDVFGKTTLTPTEGKALSNIVFRDPTQSGEYMFLLLAWITGARAKEIALMKWSDITPIFKNDPSRGCALTIQNTQTEFYSERRFPLPNDLCELLEFRLNHITNEYKTANPGVTDVSEIKNYPICCAGNDYSKPLDIETAINAANTVFQQIGVSKERMRYLELTIKLSDCLTVQQEEYAVIYFLRRTFATYCRVVGITHDESCYLLNIPTT